MFAAVLPQAVRAGARMDATSFDGALLTRRSLKHSQQSSDRKTSSGATWIGIGIAMTFPAMADASLNRTLQPIAPFASAIAAFSYTLYLTHRPTNNILATIFPNRVNIITLETLSVYGLRVAICVLVATAFYFCFERNTQAVRRIFKTRQTPARPDGALALNGLPKK